MVKVRRSKSFRVQALHKTKGANFIS